MIDAEKGAQILCVGRKGSGKSHLARAVFDSFPYDALVLDITGDVRADLRRDGVPLVDLTPPLPVRYPGPPGGVPLLDSGEPREPVTAVYVPDMGSPEAPDEMDRALGLAYNHRRSAVWIDEIGVVTSGSKTPANLRRMLHHGRHRQLTLLMCGPRPMDIDPLCLANCDHVFVFSLPNPNDRKRIADSIGWPPKVFSDAVDDLRGHEYLWFEQAAHELRQMPPLPARGRAPRGLAGEGAPVPGADGVTPAG